jgi:type IV secretory pathway VirB2 component (pilin)
MKKTLFIISLFFILVPIFSVFAQETSDDAPATGFRSNIIKFLRNVIAFPVVVLMIIYGGVMMIFSGGSPTRINTGKKSMTSALIGFGIVWGVSLILNSALMIITKSPASFNGFISGDLSKAGWSCEKDCGSGTTDTGEEDPTLGKDDIPGVTWDPRVSTAGVNNCIMKAIKDLADKYPNKITVTSLNDRSHSTNSYHYQGKAGDLWTNNKKEWDDIKKYLNDQGFTSFCDAPRTVNGKTVYVSIPCSGSESTHIHFDMRNMAGKTCP